MRQVVGHDQQHKEQHNPKPKPGLTCARFSESAQKSQGGCSKGAERDLWLGQERRQACVHRSLVANAPDEANGAFGHRHRSCSDEQASNNVGNPVDAEVHNGERSDHRVEQDRVAVTGPPAVFVIAKQAQPHDKRDADVQAGHPVGEGVDAPEPIRDFWGQIVSDGLHAGDDVTRHSDVEKEVEGHGQDVDPSDGQHDAIGHPTVVKVRDVEDGNVADEHESRDVEVCQGARQPPCFESFLHPEHQVAFNRVNPRRHVEVGVGHQDPVDLIEEVLRVVDHQQQEHVDPIPADEVDETRERQAAPRRRVDWKQHHAQRERADHPRQVDAFHAPAFG